MPGKRKQTTRPSINKAKTIRGEKSVAGSSKRASVKPERKSAASSKNKRLKTKSTKAKKETIKAKTKSKRARSTQERSARASQAIMSEHVSRHKQTDVKTKSKARAMSATAIRYGAVALIAIAIIIIGIIVAITVYTNTTSAKMAIDASAKSELVKVQQGSPYYILYAVDSDASQDGIYDMLILGRADEQDKQAILVPIPMDTYIASAAGGGTTLTNICKNGSDADLITAVMQFSEVSLNHFVKMNAEGLKETVDTVGGIEVTLSEQIDDPTAGSVYIPSGTSTIDGEQALTLLRAKNFESATATILKNQAALSIGLTMSVLNYSPKDMSVKLESLAENIKTDMSLNDCTSMLEKFKGIEHSNILSSTITGYKGKRNNQEVFIVDATEWKKLRTQMSEGYISNDDKEATTEDINPSSFTVHVQNGSGVDGAGSYVTDTLTKAGYKVIKTDNANTSAYSETLVIYNDENMKKNAQAVKNAMNNGRLVQSNGMYTMDSDILVIIGADLKM